MTFYELNIIKVLINTIFIITLNFYICNLFFVSIHIALPHKIIVNNNENVAILEETIVNTLFWIIPINIKINGIILNKKVKTWYIAYFIYLFLLTIVKIINVELATITTIGIDIFKDQPLNPIK